MRINESDLQITSGLAPYPTGGQQAVTVHSGVRVKHLPSGTVAECYKERSQLRNKNVCMRMIEWALADDGGTQ